MKIKWALWPALASASSSLTKGTTIYFQTNSNTAFYPLRTPESPSLVLLTKVFVTSGNLKHAVQELFGHRVKLRGAQIRIHLMCWIG